MKHLPPYYGRTYLRPGPTPKMPPGLEELMEGLTKEVLRHNPSDIYSFCLKHMENLIQIRETHLNSTSPMKKLSLDEKIKKAQKKVNERALQKVKNNNEKPERKINTESVAKHNPESNKIGTITNNDKTDSLSKYENNSKESKLNKDIEIAEKDECSTNKNNNGKSELPESGYEKVNTQITKNPDNNNQNDDENSSETITNNNKDEPVIIKSNDVKSDLTESNYMKQELQESQVTRDRDENDPKDNEMFSETFSNHHIDESEINKSNDAKSDSTKSNHMEVNSQVAKDCDKNDQKDNETLSETISNHMKDESEIIRSNDVPIEKNLLKINDVISESMSYESSNKKVSSAKSYDNNTNESNYNNKESESEVSVENLETEKTSLRYGAGKDALVKVEGDVNKIEVHDNCNEDQVEKNVVTTDELSKIISAENTYLQESAEDTKNDKNKTLTESNNYIKKNIDNINGNESNCHEVIEVHNKLNEDIVVKSEEKSVNMLVNAKPTSILQNKDIISDKQNSSLEEKSILTNGNNLVSSKNYVTEKNVNINATSENNESINQNVDIDNKEECNVTKNMSKAGSKETEDPPINMNSQSQENHNEVVTCGLSDLNTNNTLKEEENLINLNKTDENNLINKTDVEGQKDTHDVKETKDIKNSNNSDLLKTNPEIKHIEEKHKEVTRETISYMDSEQKSSIEESNSCIPDVIFVESKLESEKPTVQIISENILSNTEVLVDDLNDLKPTIDKIDSKDIETNSEASIMVKEMASKNRDNVKSMNNNDIEKQNSFYLNENIEKDSGSSDSKNKSILDENINVVDSDLIPDDNSVKKQPSMDLETAAITIQKVFRSFMFKSRTSILDEIPNYEESIDIPYTPLQNSIENEIKSSQEFITSNADRRTAGITRMDTVLQTVNEEKSLSLSTDDSSTLSSAATTIQAHVRGFLVRNRLNSNKTNSSSSVINSDGMSIDIDNEGHKNKTILNIHIVPEGGQFMSRDDSIGTSADLSFDVSPRSSNLHPLGYDKTERRKQLKREDAIQSVSPPSNNSGKLSEDVESVKEFPLPDSNENQIVSEIETANEMIPKSNDAKDVRNEDDSIGTSPSKSTTADTVIEVIKVTKDEVTKTNLENKKRRFEKMSSDEMDVVTPDISYDDESSVGSQSSRLLHSGEFHDIVLPTRISRNEASVVREFQNAWIYFLRWS